MAASGMATGTVGMMSVSSVGTALAGVASLGVALEVLAGLGVVPDAWTRLGEAVTGPGVVPDTEAEPATADESWAGLTAVASSIAELGTVADSWTGLFAIAAALTAPTGSAGGSAGGADFSGATGSRGPLAGGSGGGGCLVRSDCSRRASPPGRSGAGSTGSGGRATCGAGDGSGRKAGSVAGPSGIPYLGVAMDGEGSGANIGGGGGRELLERVRGGFTPETDAAGGLEANGIDGRSSKRTGTALACGGADARGRVPGSGPGTAIVGSFGVAVEGGADTLELPGANELSC